MTCKIVATAYVGLLVCLATLSVLAADDTVNTDLSRLKATYAKEMKKISDAAFASVVSDQEKYIASLKDLQKKMQMAGKLDPVLAIGREIERFSASRELDPDTVSKDIPELAPVQSAYIKAVSAYPLEQARRTLGLAQNYEKALDALQETLTKKNDIPGALEIKSEKESLNRQAEVVAARALVANAEAKDEPEPAAAQAGEPGKGPAGQAAVAKPATKRKYACTPDNRIRQRFDDLAKCLAKRDFLKASELVDPDFVKNQGIEGVRNNLMVVFPFLRLADDPRRKLDVDSVVIDKASEKGTLVARIWVASQWRELPSSTWVDKEGDWYLDLAGMDEQDRWEAAREARRLEWEGDRRDRRPGRRR